MNQLIEYENGDRVIWNGKADVLYHRTKIINKTDLLKATEDEIQSLITNPHNEDLLNAIKKR